MTLESFLGVVYLIYHVLVQKSIIWSDFNLQGEGGEILQAGLGLFTLQVGGSKSEQKKWQETGSRNMLVMYFL